MSRDAGTRTYAEARPAAATLLGLERFYDLQP